MRPGRPGIVQVRNVSERLQILDDPKMVYSIGVCHHQLKNNTQAIEALRWGQYHFLHHESADIVFLRVYSCGATAG
jgi:hypothetical protein